MTATASRPLQFEKDKSIERLKGQGGVFDYLANLWVNYTHNWDPTLSTDTWILWDIAQIEVIIHPNLAEKQQLSPPAELQVDQTVWVYTKNDADKMKSEYWSALEKAMK